MKVIENVSLSAVLLFILLCVPYPVCAQLAAGDIVLSGDLEVTTASLDVSADGSFSVYLALRPTASGWAGVQGTVTFPEGVFLVSTTLLTQSWLNLGSGNGNFVLPFSCLYDDGSIYVPLRWDCLRLNPNPIEAPPPCNEDVGVMNCLGSGESRTTSCTSWYPGVVEVGRHSFGLLKAKFESK